MQVPAAMFIESAVDALPNEAPAIAAAKKKELHVAMGHRSPQFVEGYLLGLKTAEVLARTAVKAGPA